ncbi:MAG: lectin-like protein [Candidatus Hodarchaeales archaeon]|jgi:hypothetical protein
MIFNTGFFSSPQDSFLVKESSTIDKYRIQSSQQDNLSFNGHDYLLVRLIVDWQYAREDCESRNMHLVTITSSEEQEFVNSMVNLYEIWIGATDEVFLVELERFFTSIT